MNQIGYTDIQLDKTKKGKALAIMKVQILQMGAQPGSQVTLIINS